MKLSVGSIIALAVVFFFTATIQVQAVSLSDVYVHYTFDETSGTQFADASSNLNHANFYRPPTYDELATVDIYEIYTTGQFGSAIPIGQQTILGENQQVMIDVPTASHLPAAGDSFAVSFWLSATDWGNTYGLLGSYNYQGLEFQIGMHNNNAIDGLLVSTNDANETGNGVFAVNCGTAGLNLTPNTYNHFVIQFDGDNGISNIYVNGTAATDAGADSSAFWGNEREGITLGGRVLDARDYTTPTANTLFDDFAIVSGTVDATDVSNLMTSGASSLGTRRLLHYSLDDTSGSTIVDSSSYANNGTLIANNAASVPVIDDLAPAARPGVIGSGAVEIASGFKQYAQMTNVDSLPGVSGTVDETIVGDEFTVSFWVKMDENMSGLYGWDVSQVITSWSNDTLGFSVGIETTSDGALMVRRTTGDYTSSANESTYGVYLGTGPEDSGNPGTYLGLGLDPTEYHHVAVTVGTNGVVSGIYVDGEYAAKTVSNGFGVSDEETGSIGCRIKNGVTDKQFCGYLDDLAVIKGQLTEAQIEQAMTQGVASLYNETPPIPGDANKDGYVDGSDATILAGYWQQTNATWEMGDFNGDLVVDGSDATILAGYWQTGTPPTAAAVPEPSTLILVLSALVFLALRARKS